MNPKTMLSPEYKAILKEVMMKLRHPDLSYEEGLKKDTETFDGLVYCLESKSIEFYRLLKNLIKNEFLKPLGRRITLQEVADYVNKFVKNGEYFFIVQNNVRQMRHIVISGMDMTENWIIYKIRKNTYYLDEQPIRFLQKILKQIEIIKNV